MNIFGIKKIKMSATPEQTIANFKALLKKKSALNRILADKQAELDYEKASGITPQITTERPLEEEMKDINDRRIELTTELQRLIRPEVAAEFVSKLVDEQILFLLQVFPEFHSDLRKFNARKLDADFLSNLLNRFMDKYRTTQGIDIPQQAGQPVKIEVFDVRNAEPIKTALIDSGLATPEEALNFVSKLSSRELGAVDNAKFIDYAQKFPKDKRPSLISIYKGYVGQARTSILDRANAFTKPDQAEKYHEFKDQMGEEYARREHEDLQAEDIRKTINRSTKQASNLEELYIRAAANHNKTVKSIREGEAEVAKLQERIDHAKTAPQRTRLTERYTKDQTKVNRLYGIEAQYKQEMDDIEAEWNDALKEQQFAKEHHPRYVRPEPAGTKQAYKNAAEYTQFEPSKPNVGITPQDDDDPRFHGFGLKRRRKSMVYSVFGRHKIHVPHLKRNELVIRFPSGAMHPRIPRIKISDAVRDLFLNAVQTGKISPRMAHALNEKEKRLIHRICSISSVDSPLVFAEDEDELKRFDILRGELQAGNNNPEIIKEIKRLLLKFMMEGRINKGQGMRTLFELAAYE